MNIWVLGRNYPLPENGMQGSFEIEQAKMLAKHGENVCYLACCLHPIKKIKGSGMQIWNEDGIEVYTYSAFFFPRMYPIYFNSYRNKCWSKLLNSVKERIGLPDVIHIHYPSMLMISDALLPFKKAGVKIVMTEHWTKVLSEKLDPIELKQYKKCENVVDTFICVGSPLATAVERTINVKPIVIPNIVNNVFSPSKKDHKGFEFIAVGRLEKVKQFDKIVEAFSACFRGKSGIHLSIIGNGSEKKALAELIHKLRIEDQVTLLGELDREATAKHVANADCLICYSRLETFGVPIIEAWACGIPTITTTAAAVIDKFDNKLGMEVSPDDLEGLKKCLAEIYEKKSEFNREFISKFAEDHFSEDVIYRKLQSLYEKEDKNLPAV